MITRAKSSRRSFLRGAGGAAVALPMLPSLWPHAHAGGGAPPRRLVVVVQPQGFIMDEWRPVGVGTDFQLAPILSPLESLRDRIVVISGLVGRATPPAADGQPYEK